MPSPRRSPLRDLTPRADGYLQVCNLQFIAEGFFAEGMEANLARAVTDLDGVRVERQVRVRLTLEPVADLP